VTHGAERLVSRVLLAGGGLAVALMLAGLIGIEWSAAHRASPRNAPRVTESQAAGRAADVFVSLPQLGRALRRRPPPPAAALVAGLAAFAVAGDRWYTAISAVLAAALLCGFFFNAGG
jgi:hypothetical protein